MPGYVLIESRDPFESKGFYRRCELAMTLMGEDTRVTVFLVENGVLAARAEARTREFEMLSKAGVKVLADEFALRERGIRHTAPVVQPVGLDALVGELAGGAKAMWN